MKELTGFEVFEEEYGFDKKLAKGNWFTIKGIKIKLAYINEETIEASVQSARAKKEEELGRALIYEELEEIGNEVFVDLCILDWEVKDLECNAENKRAVIEKHPLFLQDCVAKASVNKNFRQKRIEETAKK